VRLRVSPGDVGALEALGVPLEPDPSMERGGCVVHTELGDVDARVEVRLEALLRAIERAG
ncbi:MAG: flagellar assembly protein FliH, partial [Sandaracinaceae bacterium]|nr:flagellar assembly protein FliH [Sandaracinaceae bacterium]